MKKIISKIGIVFFCSFLLTLFMGNHVYAAMGNVAIKGGKRDFKWPVPGKYGISSCFYDGRGHYAIDIQAEGGTNIVAAYNGKVVEVTYNGNNDGGYGNAVMVQHSYATATGSAITLYTRYAHMKSISVSVGQTVYGASTVLGTVGGSGYGQANYYGNHLDFQILTSTNWRNRSACSIDPFANQLLELPSSVYTASTNDCCGVGPTACCCHIYINEAKALYSDSQPDNSPFGYLDWVRADTGKITVHGWAADLDAPNQAISVHFYAVQNNERIWLGSTTADNRRADICTSYPSINEYHGYEATFNTSLSGELQVEAYGINVGSSGHNVMLWDAPKTVTVPKDTTPPKITNVSVSDVSEEGYTVSCDIWDNADLDYVQFVTWTPDKGGFDDKTEDYQRSGFTSGGVTNISFHVKTSDHNNETGRYATHIYAFDKCGNSVNVLTNVAVGGKYWKPASTIYYGGHTYELYNTTYWNWSTAKTYCDSIGGYLVCITSAEEQEAIEGLLNDGSRQVYWIGSTDQYVEGEWTWITGENMIYGHWNDWEPNDTDSTQNYGVINYPSGNWGDAREDVRDDKGDGVYGFICEFDSSETCTITYHMDGGTNHPSNPAECAMGSTLVLQDPTKEGCQFIGWFTSETGDEEFTANSVCNGNLDLYARWSANTYRITYDANGGTINGNNTATAEYGKPYGTMPSCTREGYQFTGWFTTPDGTSRVTENSICKGDITLYAHWESGNSGHTHIYEEMVETEATCTEPGVIRYTCTECGDYYTEEIPAAGHSKDFLLSGDKEATCTEEGYTGDAYCLTCGELLQKGNVIKVLDHVWDAGVVTKEATEATEGIRTYTCTVCNTTKEEMIPATGNSPTQPTDPKPTQRPTTPKPTVTQQPHKSHVGKTFVVNGLKYKVTKDDTSGREVRVTSMVSDTDTLNIPATVTNAGWKESFKVTSIKAKAFKNKSFAKAVIGNNVTKIGPNAFYHCWYLQKVVIGKSVKSIGVRAFYKCDYLKKVNIKSTVLTTVKKNAFKKLYWKAVIKVPKGKKKAYKGLLKGKIDRDTKIK